MASFERSVNSLEIFADLTGDRGRLERLKEKLGIADAIDRLVGGDDEAADAIKDALGAVLGGGSAESASGNGTDGAGDEPRARVRIGCYQNTR